jgi:hypothetical protein
MFEQLIPELWKAVFAIVVGGVIGATIGLGLVVYFQ